MKKKAKPKALPSQVERSKRAAAGGANSTKGRANVFKDRKVYDRKDNKKEIESMTNDEYNKREKKNPTIIKR